MKSLLDFALTPQAKAPGWTGAPDILGDPKQLRYPGAGDKTAEQAATDICPKVDEELARK